MPPPPNVTWDISRMPEGQPKTELSVGGAVGFRSRGYFTYPPATRRVAQVSFQVRPFDESTYGAPRSMSAGRIVFLFEVV
jgi:hypothetical protein